MAKVTKLTVCTCPSCIKKDAEALMADLEDLCGDAVPVRGMVFKDCSGKSPRVQLQPVGKKLDNGQTTWPQPVHKDSIDSYRKMMDLMKKDVNVTPSKATLTIAEHKYTARRCQKVQDAYNAVDKAFAALGGEKKAYSSEPKEASRLHLIKATRALIADPQNGLKDVLTATEVWANGHQLACSHAKRASELDPECGYALKVQADCLEKLEQLQEALDAITKALDLGGRGFKQAEAKPMKERLEEALGGSKKAQEEAEAAAKAEEEKKKAAEEAARQEKADAEAKRKKEEAEKKRQAELAKRKSNAEAKKKADEEAAKLREEAQAEEEARLQKEAEEEEAKRKAEEAEDDLCSIVSGDLPRRTESEEIAAAELEWGFGAASDSGAGSAVSDVSLPRKRQYSTCSSYVPRGGFTAAADLEAVRLAVEDDSEEEEREAERQGRRIQTYEVHENEQLARKAAEDEEAARLAAEKEQESATRQGQSEAEAPAEATAKVSPLKARKAAAEAKAALEAAAETGTVTVIETGKPLKTVEDVPSPEEPEALRESGPLVPCNNSGCVQC